MLANWDPVDEETKQKSYSYSDSSFVPEQFHLDLKRLRAGKTQIRWRRSDDQRLFEALENYCQESGDTLDQIRSRAINKLDPEVLWNHICAVVQWKGQLKPLVDRFVKLYSSDTLSTREIKLLRKLIRQKRKNPTVKWTSILNQFPGKSVEFIRNYAHAKKWISRPEDLQHDDI